MSSFFLFSLLGLSDTQESEGRIEMEERRKMCSDKEMEEGFETHTKEKEDELRKRRRGNKWAKLYFLPQSVLDQGGMKIFDERTCKMCNKTFHKRISLHLHNIQCHKERASTVMDECKEINGGGASNLQHPESVSQSKAVEGISSGT